MGSRWFWVLEAQDVVYNGAELPTGTEFDRWTESVIAYPFHAPLLARDASGQHNEDTNEVLGRFVEWRVMDPEEAAAKGIPIRGGRALYGRVEYPDHLEDRVNAIDYISPGFELNFIDELGERWPCVMRHVAEVAVPFQQLTQPRQSALVTVTMSRRQTMNEEVIDNVEAVAEVAAEEVVEDKLSSFEQEIAELRARVEALEGKGAEAAPVEMSRKSVSVDREIAAHMTARDISEKYVWAGTTEQLVAMCRDKSQVEILRKSLRPRVEAATPKTGVQMARGGNEAAPESLDAAARLIMQRENIGYAQALRLAAGGK